jgi:lactate dehydrogenase-like 2-hydroxyacid dehydrogenase
VKKSTVLFQDLMKLSKTWKLVDEHAVVPALVDLSADVQTSQVSEYKEAVAKLPPPTDQFVRDLQQNAIFKPHLGSLSHEFVKGILESVANKEVFTTHQTNS